MLKDHIVENQDLINITLFGSISAIVIIIGMAVVAWVIMVRSGNSFDRKDAMKFFIFYFASYIFISYCVTGAFGGIFLLNHHLYVANFIVVMVLSGKKFPAFFEHNGLDNRGTKWLQYFVAVVVIILILTFIIINIHSELNGANARFPTQ